jgi:hypothetical protein
MQKDDIFYALFELKSIVKAFVMPYCTVHVRRTLYVVQLNFTIGRK